LRDNQRVEFDTTQAQKGPWAAKLGRDPADWAGLPREPGGSCPTAT